MSDVYKIVSTLISEEPFFGHLLAQMMREETDKIPTLGVCLFNSKIRLLINPQFLDSIRMFKYKVGILKHEVLHVILKHILRTDFLDKERANIAMDLVINQMVGRDKLPPNEEHKGQYIEDFQKKWGDQKFPLNETTDYYYKQLEKISDKDLGMAPKHYWTVMDSEGNLKKLGPNDLSEAERVMVEAQMKEMVERAKTQAKSDGWGKVPGNLRALLDEMLEQRKPQLPWKVILKRFVARAIRSRMRFTMKRPSKRFGERPGLKKEKQLNLVLALDTSGSVADEQFVKFFSEMEGIAKQGANITVIQCDHGVQAVHPFKKKMHIERHGYGGTSFDPVYQFFLENNWKKKYDAIIYCTDGFAAEPTINPGVPVLYVITNDGCEGIPGQKNLILPK